MKWYGKAIGFILVLILTKRLQLAIIGLLIGHAYDAGWFTRRPRALDKSPYEELGIDPGASDAEVERAFRRLISQYHPDRVAGAAPELREQAERRASAINAAYEAIQKQRRQSKG